jgi:hypothetical protein
MRQHFPEVQANQGLIVSDDDTPAGGEAGTTIHRAHILERENTVSPAVFEELSEEDCGSMSGENGWIT